MGRPGTVREGLGPVNSSLSGTIACLIHYDQSGGVLYLSDDSAPTWIDSATPSTATLGPTQTQQFLATVTGDANNSVNWTVTPAGIGSISNTGLYTAPPSVSAQQVVTIRATSTADPTKSATAALTLTPPPAGPRPITIYNTGVFSPGVPANNSVPDPHYRLLSSPDPAFPGPNAFLPGDGYPIGGPWIAYGGLSNWISPQIAAGNGNTQGAYTYRTTFDLTGLNPATATLTGRFASAGIAAIRLNNTTVGPASASFTSWTSFTLSSGFAPGLNTLDFVVTNGGTGTNPTGLRVEIGGTASPLTTGVNLTIAPSTPAVYPSQTLQFAAAVTGSANTAVTWSVSPAVGTVSATGVYTAPATISSQQLVTVRATSVADTTRSAVSYVTLNQAPGAFSAIRVNSGGAAYTDPQGNVWSADYGYSGNGGAVGTGAAIAGTTSDPIYQSTRFGDTTYTFPVPNGNYTVTLKFDESYGAVAGQRSFHVYLNGTNVLPNFDIAAAAGGTDTAVDRTFTLAVTGHQIVIQTQIVNWNALIGGIEIIQNSGGTDVLVNEPPVTLIPGQTQQFTATVLGNANTAVNWSVSPAGSGTISSTGLFTAPASIASQQIASVVATSVADSSRSASVFVTLNPPSTSFIPIRMKCGGPEYTDQQGKLWRAEYGLTYSNGGTAITGTSVSGTTTPLVYHAVRFGDATYDFAVPNGTYNVTFKLAELFLNSPGRTTNYAINGTTVLPAFDIYVAAGGANKAIDRTFPVTVTNGHIVLVAYSVNFGTIINAIEITQPQLVNITMAPGAVALSDGQAQQFVATVTGTANTNVNWSISPAGAGTILSDGTYIAPATVTAAQTVIVTATSAADPTKTASASVSLVPTIHVTVTPASPTLYNGQTQQFAAAVTGTANTAVTWSLSPAGSGTITAGGLFTAPALITADQAVTVTATSAADTSKSGTASLLLLSIGQITTVAPASARAGDTTAITITGLNTSFVQGTTQASLGAGIAVGGAAEGAFGPVTVTSPTTAVATVAINRSATLSAKTLSVKTSTPQITLASALTVTEALPLISLTAPANLSFTNITPTTVTGTVSPANATVTVNGLPASGGSFSIQVQLVEGNNTVTAVARSTTGLTSTASVLVTLDTTPPRVTINSPADQFTTTATSITVTGTVNDLVVGTVNDQQATVTVNGTAAQVANRSFVLAGVPLNLGANTIQAIGRDRTNNSATASIVVTRVAQTTPEIRVTSGNGQAGAISTALPQPLVVTLVNAAGVVQAGKTVVFKIVQNNGSLNGGAGVISSFQNGTITQSVALNTNAQGQASVNWTLGSHSGAGNNRVEATGTGFSGTAVFTATGNPSAAAMISVDAGGGQIGATGAQLARPFVVVVTDAGHNRLGGVPVTFTATAGGGNIGGVTTVTNNSDSDGRALVDLVLGPLPGIENNVVEATFLANTGAVAKFIATAMTPGNPTATQISGVVLDNTNKPIPGVTMRLYLPYQGPVNNVPVPAAPAVTTNAQGQFVIPSAPVGKFKLMADGGTVSPGNWPTIDFDLVTIAGQNNTVGMPIYLLPLDPANQLCVSPTAGGTLTLQKVPGFSLVVAANSATFPGGSKSGCINVTPVHIDKVPMVPGFGQQPRFVVTIQPVGTSFNPPAAITIPNVDGLKPREVTELYSFDHDLNSFVAIGTGTVSDDGMLLRSDLGVGVVKAGWHCAGNSIAAGDCENVHASINLPISDDEEATVGTVLDVIGRGNPAGADSSFSDWSTSSSIVAAFLANPSCPGSSVCLNQLSVTAAGSINLLNNFQKPPQTAPASKPLVVKPKPTISVNAPSLVRGNTATFTVSAARGSIVTKWIYVTDSADTEVSQTIEDPSTSSLRWTGVMAASGRAKALVRVPGSTIAIETAEIAVTVNPRTGFRSSTTPVPYAYGVPLPTGVSWRSPMSHPPRDEDGQLGQSTYQFASSWRPEHILSGPNTGLTFTRIYNDQDSGGRQLVYVWTLNPDLGTPPSTLNGTSPFVTNNCGAGGFIGAADLLSLTSRHEALDAQKSHWVAFSSELAKDENNLGALAEKFVRLFPADDFNILLDDTIRSARIRIQDAQGHQGTSGTGRSPYNPYPLPNQDPATGLSHGRINFSPYAPCP